MICNLIKKTLNFDLALTYIKDILDDANILSSSLLNLLKMEEGSFFTLLPSTANFEKIYDFKAGGILVQYPIQEYMIDGKKASYSLIPTIRDELSEIIFKNIKSENNFSCFFDEVTRFKDDKKHNDLFYKHALFFENEIYYFIDKKNTSTEIIVDCLDTSNAFWHSLCLLSDAHIKINDVKELSHDDIANICFCTKVFLVGAYDGEGYIFWEKKTINFC